MNEMIAEKDREELARLERDQIIDPRAGDIGNDHSATKQRSLLAILGSMLAEISIGKLLFAWFISIMVPGVLLGVAPLAFSAWASAASNRIAEATGYSVVVLVVIAAAAAAWFGGRPCCGWRRTISGR